MGVKEVRVTLDPFRQPGSKLPDRQLPPKPASRVFLTDPSTIAAFGGGAVFDHDKQPLNYTVDSDADEQERFVDVEHAFSAVLAEIIKLRKQTASMNTFMEAVSHGAILSGLYLQSSTKERTLQVDGGKMAMVIEGVIEPVPILAATPLDFFVASGAAIIGESTFSEVPELCAAETGETVKQTKGTYRVDLLAIAPKGPDGIEWYLVLGGASNATSLAASESIHTPTVPGLYKGVLFPMYRVVSKGGSVGVAFTKLLATRFRVNGW